MPSADKIAPSQFPHTDMTPSPKRGKFPRYVYLIEFAAGLFSIPVAPDYFLVGLIIITHAIYRMSTANLYQAPCPHCQTVIDKLKENGKPLNCKVCKHRLVIYGTKLADVSGKPATATMQEASVVQAAGNPLSPDQEYLVVTSVKRHKAIEGISAIIVIGLFAWWMSGGGEDHLNNHLADRSTQQYDIAKRQGNRMDMCTQAGVAAQFFLGAKDEKSYAYWKSIQEADCRAAGLR